MKLLFWIALFVFQLSFVRNAMAMTKAESLHRVLDLYSTLYLVNEAGTAGVSKAFHSRPEWRDIEDEILNETSESLGWNAFGSTLGELVKTITKPDPQFPNWWFHPWYPEWNSNSSESLIIGKLNQNGINWNQIENGVKLAAFNANLSKTEKCDFARTIGRAAAQETWRQFIEEYTQQSGSASVMRRVEILINRKVKDDMLNSDVSIKQVVELMNRPFKDGKSNRVLWDVVEYYQSVISALIRDENPNGQ